MDYNLEKLSKYKSRHILLSSEEKPFAVIQIAGKSEDEIAKLMFDAIGDEICDYDIESITLTDLCLDVCMYGKFVYTYQVDEMWLYK